MANSQSNIYKNEIIGTSPEENMILRYFIDRYGIELVNNPYEGENGDLTYRYQNKLYTVKILERKPYKSMIGKYAKIIYDDEEFIIHQGPPDLVVGEHKKIVKEQQSLNPRRALSISRLDHIKDIKDLNDMNNNHIAETTEFRLEALIFFENPIRESCKETFAFLKKKGINVNILTGDGVEAAMQDWLKRQD
jgi:magnesium-transporting ATPase (P-type)